MDIVPLDTIFNNAKFKETQLFFCIFVGNVWLSLSKSRTNEMHCKVGNSFTLLLYLLLYVLYNAYVKEDSIYRSSNLHIKTLQLPEGAFWN